MVCSFIVFGSARLSAHNTSVFANASALLEQISAAGYDKN
jgi:hypothetical protein